MRKRGPKPKGQVNLKWSPEFAYAIGLIVTDGSLSKNGRHIDLTSKDVEQLENFKRCLGLTVKIGSKAARKGRQRANRVQFGDVLFYRFLEGIGLTPAKTKTIGSIDVPKKYFFDFLRGHLDGDGYFYSFWDKRWKNSFMFYTGFVSSSKKHIFWLQKEINKNTGVKGNLQPPGKNSVYNLKYAKKESLKLLRKIYHNKRVVCLSRKRLKIEEALSIVGEKI